MFFTRHQPFLGVDIRPHELRLVYFSHDVVSTERMPLDPLCFKHAVITDFTSLVTQLRNKVRECGLVGAKTAISLPYHLVYTKKLEFPRGIKKSAVRQQIQHEVRVDFGGFNDAELEVTQEQGCYYVVRKEYRESVQQCVQAAHLKPSFIDIDLLALIHFYKLHLSRGEYGLILHEAHTWTLIIFDETLQFHAQWFDDDKLTERINGFLALFKKRIKEIYFCNLSECKPVQAKLDVDLRQLNTTIDSSFHLAAGLALRAQPTW